MNFHVLTLFPQMVMDGVNTSIIKRASDTGFISIEAIDIRDYTIDRHKKTDDYPYGGGAGMVMSAQPIYDAHKALQNKIGKKTKCIYLTPQGRTFNQNMAKEFAEEEDLIFLCGHYEGVDERVLEEIVTDYVSIGDYVLTGGELAAMVMIDAISRMVPGVLSNKESSLLETFEGNLLEYPQYTRPVEWRGKKVPDILLSGHHANVEKWRRYQSLERTYKYRPDLLDKASLDENDIKYLEHIKNNKKI